jgi:hypothetical protein
MSENGQKEEEQEKHGDNDVNVLTKERVSWNDFDYSLREENRLLINNTLSECTEHGNYIRAVSSRDKYLAKSLFMVLIAAAKYD